LDRALDSPNSCLQSSIQCHLLFQKGVWCRFARNCLPKSLVERGLQRLSPIELAISENCEYSELSEALPKVAVDWSWIVIGLGHLDIQLSTHRRLVTHETSPLDIQELLICAHFRLVSIQT
jgi:hypothetical protein